MAGTLYVVATPIGNLGDITLRALEVLRSVDFVLCEDTRVTRKLLEHFNIKTPTLSYHAHSKLNRTEQILGLLKGGKNLALVSDAGTPAISDPGSKLIAAIHENCYITSVPGASALTAAASIAGFSMDKFVFMGFPPAKKKRKKFFAEVTASKYPVIFYESPHRILRTLNELDNAMESDPRRGRDPNGLSIVVCRELTKKFETVYRGRVIEVQKKLKDEAEIRGEFVVIINK